MNRPYVTVPRSVLKFTSVDWQIDWREQSSGMSVAGRRNVNLGRLPRWVSAPGAVFPREKILAWRSIQATARGMTGIYQISMTDPVGFNQPEYGVTFEGGNTFDGGVTFEGEYTVRCDAGALAGASEVVVVAASASVPIVVGQILSHNHWPFMVTEISGNTLRVEPPLRAAIPAGDLINLRATGLFEMDKAMAGNPAYDGGRVAFTSLSLVEWLR